MDVNLNIFRTKRGGLVLTSLLFVLCASTAVDVQASCLDLLRSKPNPIATDIYQRALDTNDFVDVMNASPEELLALLAKDSSPDLLPYLQNLLSIEAVRFSRKFDFHKWPTRVLEIPPMKDFSPNGRAKYQLRLLRFAFETKRRSIRFSLNPKNYIETMLAVTTDIDRFAAPVHERPLPGSAELKAKKLVSLRIGLGSLLLMKPNPEVMWPTDAQSVAFDREDREGQIGRRLLAHWGLSRSFIGLYLLTFASSLTELPQALETADILYKMRGDIAEMGQELKNGQPYDRRAERLNLITYYEMRIVKLELRLSEPNVEDPARLRAQIVDMQGAIQSMKAELAKLP